MLPNATYCLFVGCLAIIIAIALPFTGWYGLTRNIVISLIVAAIAIVVAMILGAALHSAIFFEPVQID